MTSRTKPPPLQPPTLQPTSSLPTTSKHIASAAFQRSNQVRHQPIRQNLRIYLANASWYFVLAFSPRLQPRVFTSSPQTLTAFRFYPFPSAEMYISLFIFSLLNIIFSLFQLRKRTQATTNHPPTSLHPTNQPPKNPPLSVNYHPTRQCNCKCGFCFHTATNSYVGPSKMLRKPYPSSHPPE